MEERQLLAYFGVGIRATLHKEARNLTLLEAEDHHLVETLPFAGVAREDVHARSHGHVDLTGDSDPIDQGLERLVVDEIHQVVGRITKVDEGIGILGWDIRYAAEVQLLHLMTRVRHSCKYSIEVSSNELDDFRSVERMIPGLHFDASVARCL